MQVIFRCGTSQKVDPDKTPSPICGHCGTHVIARVEGARMPRFTGTCTGPYADTKRLDPIAVNLAQTPLVLKANEPKGTY